MSIFKRKPQYVDLFSVIRVNGTRVLVTRITVDNASRMDQRVLIEGTTDLQYGSVLRGDTR